MHFTRLSLFASVASFAAAQHTDGPDVDMTVARHPLPTVVDVLDERGWEDVTLGMMKRDVGSEDTLVARQRHGGLDPVHEAAGEEAVRSRTRVPATTLLHTQGLRKRCTARKADNRVEYLSRPGEADFQNSGPGHTDGRPHKVSRSRRKGGVRAPKAKKAIETKPRKTKETSSASHLAAKAIQTKGAKEGDSLLGSAVKALGDTFAARITWYTGHDLLNPSCVSHSGWDPTDKSMIAAVTIDWPGKPACGQYLRLRPKNGNKAIIVRVVDSCAGCAAGSAHVDLTITAFSQLYNLDIGLVNGVQVQKIDDPVKEYDSQAIATYGPKNL